MSLDLARIRFQTDEDFDGDVIARLRKREPRIDLLTAVEAGLRGQEDPSCSPMRPIKAVCS